MLIGKVNAPRSLLVYPKSLPNMNNKLVAGDVFKVKQGMRVYAAVPGRFIYGNTPFDTEYHVTEVTVGSTLFPPGKAVSLNQIAKEIVKMMREYSSFIGVEVSEDLLVKALTLPKMDASFDTSIFEGDYVVVRDESEGGGYAHGLHDYYRDGWNVTAVKLKNGKYDKKGLNVRFYQSGSFTVVNENVPVIRKLKGIYV